MARWRRPESPAPADDEVPLELTRCVVEDWVNERDPYDLGEIEQRQRASDTYDRDFIVRMVAWRRWQAARDEWARVHDLDRRARARLLPEGRPVHRDELSALVVSQAPRTVTRSVRREP